MEGLGMNLDDGELWIPSGILPSNEVHDNRPIAPATLPIQDRSRQFGHFNPLNPTHPSVFTPPVHQHLGAYGGVAHHAVTVPTPNGCYGLTVGPNMVDHGRYNYVSGPTYQTPKLGPWGMPMNMPVQTSEAGQFKEAGLAKSCMPVHIQQPNYFVPPQGNGYRIGYPIGTSTSSGTGVFFPRSLGALNAASTSNNNRRTKKGVAAPKKGASKKREAKKKVEEKCYDYQQPSSSEVKLPKDWSY